MALTRGFIRNSPTTPLDARLMDMATVVANSDGSPRTGVLNANGGAIVTTTGTMNVSVAIFEAIGSKGRADGVTIFTNDGATNVLIGAAPGSNSRIDVIWAKLNDDTTGDANATPSFGVTAGVAAGSPVASAIPTGAVELAQLRIYSGTVATNGGSNTLTNTYRMTASRGGVVPVRTAAERTAWTTAVDGQIVYQLDTDQTWQYVNASIGWLHVAGPAVTSALSYTGLYTAGSPTPRVVEQGGMVLLEGVVAGTASFVAGTTYTLGSIPAAKAPSGTRTFACSSNATAVAALSVDSAGSITFVLNASFSGALALSLAGCGWPDKRLA